MSPRPAPPSALRRPEPGYWLAPERRPALRIPRSTFCRPRAWIPSVPDQLRPRGTLASFGHNPQVVWEVVWSRSADRLTIEREKGFEPSTSTLARLHSTTELLPRGRVLF